MQVDIMSWNTQLYEYGNLNKKIENDGLQQYQDNIHPAILKYLPDGKSSIVILQEIPFKFKPKNAKWRTHIVYDQFKKDFIDNNNYDVLCFNNGNKFHIKMTVVIARKGIIEKVKNLDNNLFIPFRIKNMGLDCLALHAHNAYEARVEISHSESLPSMLFGDFNAGNYIKDTKNNEFAVNRQNYLLLLEGYIDLVQGKYTTTYKTQIDHILFRNQIELHEKFDYSNCDVDTTVKGSDHYPIHCTITKRNGHVPTDSQNSVDIFPQTN